jgi:hypothetical protein
MRDHSLEIDPYALRWPRRSSGTAGLIVFLSLVSFVLAYAVFTNQTPRCHVHATRSDGTRIYREFDGDRQAFLLTKKLGFWEENNGLHDESDSCTSDTILPGEAIAGSTLIAAGFAFAFGPTLRRGPRAFRRRLALFLLAASTVLSIAGIYSYGLFTAPWMIPFLWLAAGRAAPGARAVWILLATICGWMTGLLIALSYDLDQRTAGLGAGALVCVAFIATSTSRSEALTD